MSKLCVVAMLVVLVALLASTALASTPARIDVDVGRSQMINSQAVDQATIATISDQAQVDNPAMWTTPTSEAQILAGILSGAVNMDICAANPKIAANLIRDDQITKGDMLPPPTLVDNDASCWNAIYDANTQWTTVDAIDNTPATGIDGFLFTDKQHAVFRDTNDEVTRTPATTGTTFLHA